jgi:hypothetical protein
LPLADIGGQACAFGMIGLNIFGEHCGRAQLRAQRREHGLLDDIDIKGAVVMRRAPRLKLPWPSGSGGNTS